MAEHISNVTGALDDSFDPADRQGALETAGVHAADSGSLACESAIAMPGFRDREVALAAREKRGWGSRYQPKIDQEAGRTEYRILCDEILAQTRELAGFIHDGGIADEASGLIAEIQASLENLYDCRFGEGESLKAVVVALQSQLNNVEWTRTHIEFLDAAMAFLRTRWIITDQTADEIDKMIAEFGLDPLRGTVSDTGVLVEYRLERVEKP